MSFFSKKQYPKLYAWLARFNKAISEAKLAARNPTNLKGPEAIQRIENGRFAGVEPSVATEDPLGFKAGDTIEVWPIDSGFGHKDTGVLLGLSEGEVVLGGTSGYTTPDSSSASEWSATPCLSCESH